MAMNFKEITDLLKSRLVEYMEIKGIEINENKFLCPSHDDTNPSASLNPSSEFKTWKCFTCGAGGSIYEMLSALEGYPVDSDHFAKATRMLMSEFSDLKDLPKTKYNEIDFIEITIRRINRIVLDLLQYSEYKDRNKYTQARGWSNETCQDLGVGTIPYIELKTRILDELNIDIENDERYRKFYLKSLFGTTRLTFTLYDHMHAPIAFSTRNMNYGPGARESKYINSPNFDGVYKKQKQVYNLSNAVRPCNKEGFIYLFEGQADVLTAWENGIKNCGAFCGTAITEDQFKALVSLKINRAIICTDSDKAGIEACRNQLDGFLYLKHGVYIEIVSVPKRENKDECDPDFFIRTNGPDAFKKLERKSAFKWLLENFPESTDKEEIVAKMIPHIGMSSSNIGWQEKISLLSKATGFEEEYIKEDVKKFKDGEKQQIEAAKSKLAEELYYEIRGGATDMYEKLNEVMKKVQHLDQGKSGKLVNIDDHIIELEKIFHEWKTYDPNQGLIGWHTGYERFDYMFDGMPKYGAFIGLAALPHMGKSAFLLNLIVNMLEQIDKGFNDDLMIYLMTIDDAARPVLSRIVALMTGLNIRDIKKLSTLDSTAQRLINTAIEKLKRWIKAGRLYIADYSITDDLNIGIRTMMDLRRQYPDRKSLFMLDNFHKLSSSSDAKERFKWIELSSRIQEASVVEQFTCLSTLEFNKEPYKTKRPELGHIAESGTINYDAQGLMLGHCDLIMDPDNTEWFWIDPNTNTKNPIFEIDVAKNKINTEKGHIYLAFDPLTTKMFEIKNIVEFKQEQAKIEDSMKTNTDANIII